MTTEFCAPGYYDKFACIASGCSDSCCRSGWEIPIDDQTYSYYKSAGVSDIDINIAFGSDGDRIFKLRPNGDCPYLMPDGLCRLYTLTGGRLGEICAQYPRFFEEYDGFTEAGLSISCPEAQRLILSAGREDYRLPGEVPQEELLEFLLRARETALDIAFCADSPENLAARLMLYGNALQDFIDFGELEFSDFKSLPGAGGGSWGELGTDPEAEYTLMREAILRVTDILYPDWRNVLEGGTAYGHGINGCDSRAVSAYLGYLVYRFFLKAVNSENIAAVCEFIACACLLTSGLPGEFLRITRLFSKEIEHNSENFVAVMDVFEGIG